MRIFHLCAGASTGGAETAFVDTCMAMHHAGMDITAICRPHKNLIAPLEQAGVRVYALPFGGVFDFKTRAALKKLIIEHQPDIVQTWMNRAAKKCQRPAASLPAFKLVARLGGYYNLKYYDGVDHFITNTPDIKTYLISKGVNADNVTPINNLVSINENAAPLNKADLDTPDNAFVFLTLARLHPVKGIDDLIAAAAQLPEHAHIWIAGNGPEKEKLETLCTELGTQNRVHFLGWRNDKDNLLKTADALVVPSRFEPFGNSFAQAWAAQCPLITTDSQGPIQYVQDGKDALVTPMNNPDALAIAMKNMMSDGELRRKIALNGYKRYQEEFTAQACLGAYTSLYRKLAGSDNS